VLDPFTLLAELALSRGDGRYVRRLGQLARIGLLVLDDFLLTPPSVIEAKDLLEVIDDRSQVRSTLVVSQLPVEAWHPALAGGDPTLADAILDRLVQHAHRLPLTGASMRRRQPPPETEIPVAYRSACLVCDVPVAISDIRAEPSLNYDCSKAVSAHQFHIDHRHCFHTPPLLQRHAASPKSPYAPRRTDRSPSAILTVRIRRFAQQGASGGTGRLQALMQADIDVARQLHADDFQLITPGGSSLSKGDYLDRIASGQFQYLACEQDAPIAVRLYGSEAAIIRFQSRLEARIAGKPGSGRFWHTDSYEKRAGRWQAVWSQATRQVGRPAARNEG
jgi:hypothetical protein